MHEGLASVANEREEKEAVKEKALRYNQDKPRWSLVHFKSLIPFVRVMEFGAKKYAPDNWKKGMDRKQLLDCAMRHLTALMDGEENDPETGLSHMGHVICNAMFYCFHYVIPEKDRT
jgi:hypothetical protein